MTTMTLQRGDAYTLPEPCKYCGEHRVVFLSRAQRTVDERVTQRFRGIFQCCWCHASRVLHFAESKQPGGRP